MINKKLAEKLVKEFEVNNLSRDSVKMDSVSRVEELYKKGELTEKESQVYIAGETLRRYGKKITPYEVSQMTGIHFIQVKEAMRSIAGKI